jgi:putative transposase
VLQEITQLCASDTSDSPKQPFAMKEVCATLGVSRSGFYAHAHKDQRVRRQQDRVIAAQLRDIFEQNLRCYGSSRLLRDLKEQGVHTSKTRVRRLMKSEGICPVQKRLTI